ncbi:MAG: hypothetical protein SH821_17875 [Phototrophicales bacterium]|nr:hypothetical protein [Phototrophicales bacterium]
MPKKIFISYKKEDLSKQEAKALEADLRKEGYAVFLDTKKLAKVQSGKRRFSPKFAQVMF